MSTHSFGILGVGDGEVAFELDSLREVVALQQPLARLPRTPAWVSGSFTLRGAQIPTVDLAALMGNGQPSSTDEQRYVVAVLASGGRRFGVLVDRVGDVISIDGEQLNTLDRADSDERLLAAHVFCRIQSDTPIYVLDIEALLAIEGMVHVSDEAGRKARAARTGNYARETARKRAVIACAGPLTFAVDADVVREIAACQDLSKPAVAIAGYLGNHRLRDDLVPVFDARSLLGEAPATQPPAQLLVIDTGQGKLALAVEHIQSMATYQSQDCLPLSGAADQLRDSVVAGLLSRPGQADALMLSHSALFAREELANIARVHAELNQDMLQQRQSSGLAWRRFAFLHFQVAGEFVVWLDQLEAVLPMPEHYAPLGHASVFEGVFRHLGALVNLVDLRRLLGREQAAGGDCRVLVVPVPAGRIGFIVDAADDIEYIEAPADSLHVYRRGSDAARPTLAQRHHCLTSVGVGERKQYLSLLCLQALAAELLGDEAALPASLCAPPALASA
ncbi:hypothetical protein S4A8_12267 [Salinisphaera sp. S4-8]|uniref:chemotaxis protein CheW n=1 Tax=Salinisphaera sp. S4-8 TaxID=633357 RepID=UPI00333FD196